MKENARPSNPARSSRNPKEIILNEVIRICHHVLGEFQIVGISRVEPVQVGDLVVEIILLWR
jgi:hypothetical protein